MRGPVFFPAMRARDLVSPPNLLSLSRVAFAVAFVGVREPQWRLGVLVAAMASDVLDGLVARLAHAETRFGALLDPIADRIFMLAAFLVVAWEGTLAWWMLALVLLRDGMVLVGWFTARSITWLRRIDFKARWPGKGVTALQFVTLLATLLAPRLVAGLSVACGVLATVATVDYTLMLWENRDGGPRDVARAAAAADDTGRAA
ncbi:MAG: CDP-alcohol phosphatidyltransferase family protein [Gemmatimonadaceae bacterium]|nr:CDP-alcohol phosphatidyltransferase family protein [Gemmatimonadaceae bacterium]